jgi:hypothetical protein
VVCCRGVERLLAVFGTHGVSWTLVHEAFFHGWALACEGCVQLAVRVMLNHRCELGPKLPWIGEASRKVSGADW